MKHPHTDILAANVEYLITTQCKSNRAEFDRRIGNKRNMARRIVSEGVIPRTETLEAIACTFSVSCEWLLEDHGFPDNAAELYSSIKPNDNLGQDDQTIIRLFLDIKEDMRRIADSQAEISAKLTKLLEKES